VTLILDTSFLIALGNGDRGAFEMGEGLATSGEVQWLPAPVIGELAYGIEMAGREDEQPRVRNEHRLYPVVEIDAETARRAGRLLARPRRRRSTASIQRRFGRVGSQRRDVSEGIAESPTNWSVDVTVDPVGGTPPRE
jgi:predicted nucleic acid-binding protein